MGTGRLLDGGAVLLALVGLGVFLKHVSDQFGTFPGADTLCWHPILMAVAVIVFLTPGTVAYTADFGRLFKGEGQRARRRTLHGALQLAGFLCMVIAWAAVVRWRVLEGIAQPLNREWDSRVREAHVYWGYVLLALALLQVGSGVFKYLGLLRLPPQKMLLWHSFSGPLLYIGMLVNMEMGVYIFWIDNSSPEEGTGEYMLVVVSALALLVLVRLFLVPPSNVAPRASGSGELGERLINSG